MYCLLMDTVFNYTENTNNHIINYLWLWYTCGIFYVPTIFGIQSIRQWIPISIKDHPVLIRVIRIKWALWNSLLAVFSLFGSYYTFNGFKALFYTDHCEWTYENNVWLNNKSGQWLFYFIVSKLVELGDTVFLAILGKPIPFLHWYHHILTVFMCFWGLIYVKPYQIVGPFTNYSIHSIMYSYYACSAVGFYWKKTYAQWITFSQTVQMILMFSYYTYIWLKGGNCYTVTLVPIIMMYSLYLILFMKYYINRYFMSKIHRLKDISLKKE